MGEPEWYFITDLIVNSVVAVGTLLAVGVAVHVASREHKARMAAEQRADAVEERERARGEREERAQALGVLVHIEKHGGFVVSNGSDQPIFGVQVTAHVPVDHTMTTELEQAIPGNSSRKLFFPYMQPMSEIARFAATFHDASGLGWARFDSGGLIRVPEDRAEARQFVKRRITAE